MRNQIRIFRLISLALIITVTLGIVGLASAQTVPAVQRHTVAFQATPEATPVNIDEPIVLQMSKSVVIPLDNDAMPYRYFRFSGKANQLVALTVSRMAGNFALQVRVSSQTDVELAEANGAFAETLMMVLKLPQDGNYQIRVGTSNPGSGDFQAGTVSVTVGDAPKPAATAAATANK